MQLIPLSQSSHWSLIPIESTSYGYLRATHASMSPLTLPYSRPSGLLTWCRGLNVCATPKFICGNPNPQCDGIWRWSLGGGEAFMVALAPLRRRDRKALSSSLTLFHSLSPQHVTTQQEDTCLQARKTSHQYLTLLSIPDLEFSASRTMSYTCLLPKPVYGSCSRSPSDLSPHPHPCPHHLWLLSPSV